MAGSRLRTPDFSWFRPGRSTRTREASSRSPASASRWSRCTSRTATATRSTFDGSLGTHELRVGDLQVDGTAHHFEVMHGEFGTIDVDAAVQLQGRFEAPRIAGDITISSGTLKVDEILSRALFQPYSTEQTTIYRDRRRCRPQPVGPARPRPVASRAGDAAAHRRERPGVAGHANRAGRHQSRRCRRLVPLQGSGGAAVDHRIVRPDFRHLRLPGPRASTSSNRARSISAAISTRRFM